MRLLAVIFIFMAVFCAAPAAWAASSHMAIAKKMVPHKALYDINMVSKSSGSQIVNISGQMFYEWRTGCDAWTTDHRFNLYYEYADSSPIRITSDFSTYETFDGKSFNFTSRRKRNGELYQEIRGSATISQNDGGEAVYTMPDGLAFNLKEGTLFPMIHSLAVLKKAEEGEKFYNATIFDGSDEEGPVQVSAFISKEVDVNKNLKFPEEVDGSLLDSKAWKIRMAFFPLLEPTADAEYEMDIILHENGIISDMLVEYRDFAVTQKLAALEKLETEVCDKTTKK